MYCTVYNALCTCVFIVHFASSLPSSYIVSTAVAGRTAPCSQAWKRQSVCFCNVTSLSKVFSFVEDFSSIPRSSAASRSSSWSIFCSGILSIFIHNLPPILARHRGSSWSRVVYLILSLQLTWHVQFVCSRNTEGYCSGAVSNCLFVLRRFNITCLSALLLINTMNAIYRGLRVLSLTALTRIRSSFFHSVKSKRTKRPLTSQ